jgi:hypothetical protein
VRPAALCLPLDGALVFFDLAGTLIELDARLSGDRCATLRRLGRRVRRLVLVTGQASDDPQVEELLALFDDAEFAPLVAYTTRGGLRLIAEGGRLRRDLAYLAKTRIDSSDRERIEEEVESLLDEHRLRPLIPVGLIDDVAVRVNLPAAARLGFAVELQDRLVHAGPSKEFRVVVEGRTSVFVMLGGVGKRAAVEHELGAARGNEFRGPAFYFGNELGAGGNDAEVIEIGGLEVCALASPAELGSDTSCRTIGACPDDLYALLRRSLDATAPVKRLAVVSLSLGGTKIEAGALTVTGRPIASEQLLWRTAPSFAPAVSEAAAASFCVALVRHAQEFIERNGYALSDVDVLGLAFPGPTEGGRWRSNNLTQPFREGVDLEREVEAALAPLCPRQARPFVHALFDAQCDAGGELYDPRGRLFAADTPPTATVLNLATGVAAGFVKEGRILVEDAEFRANVHEGYDAGAGQLGRHLWFQPAEGCWAYRFAPHGRTPEPAPGTVRMTERLSGPALAARLLLLLGQHGLRPSDNDWTAEDVTREEIEQTWAAMATSRRTPDSAEAARIVREARLPVAGALLAWADRVYQRGEPQDAAEVIAKLAAETANELAAALRTWMSEPGWAPFGRHIVLTGGTGMRFLAASDADPSRSFLAALGRCLPAGCTVERSLLTAAGEREAHVFLRWPLDRTKEEVRLAGLHELVRDRWRFVAPATRDGPLGRVDVAATSTDLALAGHDLDGFVAVPPGDGRVPRLETIVAGALKPEDVAVLVLCGGQSMRSGGKIHPLLPVRLAGAQTTTLLDLQLERLARSPLAPAPFLIAASALNGDEIQRHLSQPRHRKLAVYRQGITPLLTVDQRRGSPPRAERDAHGRILNVSTGHLDTLRWLVVRGLLLDLLDKQAILIYSYSNFGRVLDATALALAAECARAAREDATLFLAEVVARPANKRTGSLLTVAVHAPSDLRLVKYTYGRGHPLLPSAGDVLMSSNNLYFSVPRVVERLRVACPAIGREPTSDTLVDLLARAASGDERPTAAALFDAAFPVHPFITTIRPQEGAEGLRVERDLDQLSLLDARAPMRAVEVRPERAVSIKLPADLESPEKREYLFLS